MLKPLSEQEARDLLASRRVGRLGCIFEGSPYVVPVSYVFHDDRIYVHSMPGQKIAAMRANPSVCIQVDEIQDDNNWRSSIAFGKYYEVINTAERDSTLGELIARFPHLTPVESVSVQHGQQTAIVFYVLVERVTGVAEA